MSVGRCGYCGAPTMTGAICRRDWARLLELLDRAADIAPVLDTGAAKGGEAVGRSTTPALPISIPVLDAKTALGDALAAAIRVICPGVPRLAPVDAAVLLRAHARPVGDKLGALHRSYAAPVLLVELEPAISQAVQAVDIPRGRMSIPGRCRECGPSMLHPVGGMLACDRCDERMTIGEVRHAA